MKPSTVTRTKFEHVLAALEAFKKHDRKLSGMVYTDNWHDSHPRMLLLDPVLNPYDKCVWLVIRSRCSPDMSPVAFPTYDEIQSCLHISRPAVANSITKLRLTRWITLLRRETIRSEKGQFAKDGNIYLVHGEPTSLADTFEFDANYMAFAHECLEHRNTDIRKVSSAILGTLKQEIDDGANPLASVHPFERRASAWAMNRGDPDAPFYSYHPKVIQPASDETGSPSKTSPSPAVNPINYGDSEPSVNSVNQVGSSEPAQVDSSSNNKDYYRQVTSGSRKLSDSDLIFPSSLTSNQKYLILIRLNRLPPDLPAPPHPWTRWEQVLLDELEGRIQAGMSGKCESVHNPVSLLSTYCQKLAINGCGLREDGQFEIVGAESVCTKRIKRTRMKQEHEEAKQSYQREFLRSMEKNKDTS